MKYLYFILFMLLVLPLSAQQNQKFQRLQKLLEEARVPGLSLQYFAEGKLTEGHNLGYRSMDTRLPITGQTVFSGASLSKCVFAVVVMQLVDEGIIDLDIPLMQYFTYPDISYDDRSQKVTARMVLSHTSGLPNWRQDSLYFVHDPGTTFQYSGEGFVWLQKTIEQVTGKDLETLARERIFQPLSMTRTSYIFSESFDDDYAIPHDQVMGTTAKYKIENPNAAHSIQTTAEDYATFLLGILNHQLLSAQGVKNLFAPQFYVDTLEASGEIIAWGLGFGLQKAEGRWQAWHWGDNGTFKAYFTMEPEMQNGLVYFANGYNGLSITKELAGQFPIPPQPAVSWLDYQHFQDPQFRLYQKVYREGMEAVLPEISNAQGKLDTHLVAISTLQWQAMRWMSERSMAIAGPLIEAMVHSFPDVAEIHLLDARYALISGKREKAIQAFRRILELDPTNKDLQEKLERLEHPPASGTLFFLRNFSHARLVSVVGPFNHWDETAHILYWQDGGWRGYVDLPPGEHTYKFRVDGIDILDPGNAESRYDRRGHVSVIKIK